MLIQLPVETWIEILNWLRRRDLVEKLDQLWDREFTPIVQDWLHKYTRNICLGDLQLDVDGLRIRHGLYTIEPGTKVPFAEVELPANITNFEAINISHGVNLNDPVVLAFLHRMRPLFRNIQFGISNRGGDRLPVKYQENIRDLLPLISDGQHQIGSLDMDCFVLRFFSANLHAVLFNARLLCIWDYKPDVSELLTNWLFTPHENGGGGGQHRTILFYETQSCDDFCTKVKKHFLDPARQLASVFFVRFNEEDIGGEELFSSIPSTIYENARTGELLTFRKVAHDSTHYGLITCHCPLNVDPPELMAKKTAELLDWGQQREQEIHLDLPDIGLFGGYGPSDFDSEEEDEDQSDEQMMTDYDDYEDNFWFDF